MENLEVIFLTYAKRTDEKINEILVCVMSKFKNTSHDVVT